MVDKTVVSSAYMYLIILQLNSRQVWLELTALGLLSELILPHNVHTVFISFLNHSLKRDNRNA